MNPANNPSILIQSSAQLHGSLMEAIVMVFRLDGMNEADKHSRSAAICFEHIDRLYSILDEKGFGEDEILFFKWAKPLFTSEKEYHQRCYHALIFGQNDAAYYDRENVRIRKLLDDPMHQEFASYYHGERTHYDHAWFAHGNAPLPCLLCMAPWETDPKHTSARDGWVGGLLGVERYLEWLKEKYELLTVKA